MAARVLRLSLRSFNKLTVKEPLVMEHQDRRHKKQAIEDESRHYDPPRAIVVPVRPDERIMQCNFSSFRVCGPNR